MLSPQQQKSGDAYKHRTSLWKAPSAQQNMQRECGFTGLPWGQPISEGDLDLAFLSGLREKRVMWC